MKKNHKQGEKRTFVNRQDRHDLVHPEWLLQEGETDGNYAAFIKYRDMEGKRSIRLLAEQLYPNSQSKSKGKLYLESVCLSWKWVERVKAFTKYKDEIYIEQTIKEQKEIIKRHADVAKGLMNLLLEPYNVLVKKINNERRNNGKNSFDLKSIDELYELVTKSIKEIDTLSKMERTVKGVNTEVTKVDLTSNGKDINTDIVVVLPDRLRNKSE